jgi:Sulfotransferase domain
MWQVTVETMVNSNHGSMPIKPNLFIIGSMKSGTTFLWSLLASHPSIFVSRPKEPSYFVDPIQLRELLPWFWMQGARDAKIVGEASVYYTHLPLASGVAERISQFNPDARLIYVMRDPIARTISHYWHRVRYEKEYRPILHAIKNDPRYLDVSFYRMQIVPYLNAFKRDQLKLLTFEELTNNTAETVPIDFSLVECELLC